MNHTPAIRTFSNIASTLNYRSIRSVREVEKDDTKFSVYRTIAENEAAGDEKAADTPTDLVSVRGWIRSVRAQKKGGFANLNDGSNLSGLQLILSSEHASHLKTGVSVEVTGRLRANPVRLNKGVHEVELHVTQTRVIGECDSDFPMQKKRHTLEFLRDSAHLRYRSNTIGAMMRVRNKLQMSLHEILQQQEFTCVHTPVITPLDCEGAGDLFSLRAPNDGPPDSPNANSFFGVPTYLTVSGQLYAEMAACALGNVYTFGPTFRAENSNTPRHLAEFWMLEPEMAFADLNSVMDTAERMIKYALVRVLDDCTEDMEFFDKRVRPGLLEMLRTTIATEFVRMPYTEAVQVLQKHSGEFEEQVEWGDDLKTEHEKFLAEKYCQCPVFITHYPKSIKPFYMRDSTGHPDSGTDKPTVAAVDLLVPGVAELIGGSEREERADVLKEQMKQHGLDFEQYSWYHDLRRFGTVPHAGFGLGFERLVLFATGLANVRDVIPIPRTPGIAKF
jgi:asparaginyl-tRNA synthetase